MTNIETKIKEIESNEGYRAQLIRNPIKQKDDDWKKTAHEWLIHFPNGETQSYWTGSGHREAKHRVYRGHYSMTYKELKHKNLTEKGFESLLETSRATKPKLKDVLYSLTMDAYAANENFDEWCMNFGYDSDSMKAVETYKECIQSASFLRGLGFNTEELQEFFQDY